MSKIIIIGCPGAGKSTFAKKLQKITQIPLYHLDLIWYKKDKTHMQREEFDYRLQEILDKENWIIDGNYQRTLEVRLKACDTVYLLDYPTEICLEGAKSRIGKKNESLPWIEKSLDEEFKKEIINFSSEKLPQIYERLNHYKDKKIIIFKTRNEIDQYLKNLKQKNAEERYLRKGKNLL